MESQIGCVKKDNKDHHQDTHKDTHKDHQDHHQDHHNQVVRIYRLDYMNFKLPYAEKTNVVFDILEDLYFRKDITRANELIELLYWGVNNPPNLGITTLWLQQTQLLGLLSTFLTKEGLCTLVNNLAEHATSPTTRCNILSDNLNELLGWLEIEIECMEKPSELIKMVLKDESIIFVPPGTSIPFLNDKIN